MTVNIAPSVRQQFVDVNGNPLSGAKLFTYVAGTTTKQSTYTTSAGSVANSNPIVLDSAGRTPSGLWLDSSVIYKFVFAPATDTDPPTSAYYTEDNITNDYNTAIAGAILTNGSSTITANIPFGGFKATGLGAGTSSGDALSYGQANLYASSKIGYITGSGGTVTQSTSKSTAVTLNKSCGKITMNAATLNDNTAVSFTFNNSLFEVGDQLMLYATGGTTPTNTTVYNVTYSSMAAGSCSIDVRHTYAFPLAHALEISFMLFKAVTA